MPPSEQVRLRVITVPSAEEIEAAKTLFSHIGDLSAEGFVRQLSRAIPQYQGILVFAEARDEVIGASLMCRSFQEEAKATENGRRDLATSLERNYRMLELLYVRPEFRRRGVGQALLNVIDKVADELTVENILVVVESGSPAIDFFENSGYCMQAPGSPLVLSGRDLPPVAFSISSTHSWGSKTASRDTLR